MPARLAHIVVLAVILATAPALLGRPGSPAAADGRPNVLIILTDDQRATGTLRVMPHARRWFGRGGTYFPNAFATTPLCCPSRASILTGRYAHNHGVRTNADAEALDVRSAVQRYLAESGYLTAIVGKYMNRWSLRERPPHFHRWATFSPPVTPGGYYDSRFNVQGRIRTVHGYSTSFLAEFADGLIREFEAHDPRPWFMLVAPFAPHGPATPEPRYARAPVGPFRRNPAILAGSAAGKPPFVGLQRSSPDVNLELRRRQLQTLMSVDDLVGRLALTLSELGEDRDTLAFFLSDNGFLWGEHGLRKKATAYRQSVKIPFLMRWPGRVSDDIVERRLVSTLDLAPTILEAAGLVPDPEYPVDGRSLLQRWQRDRLLLEHWEEPGHDWVPDWAATWTPTHEYIEYYQDGGPAPTFREYYDLVADPWQLRNLAADRDRAAEVAALSARLALDRRCAGRNGPAACP